MDTFNAMLTDAADWVFGWFANWSPAVALLFLSAAAGILMAVVFRFTSNQRALKRAADRCRAQVLAIKLYGHDLRTMFGAVGQLLGYTGQRLWYSLPPMLVMVAPFVLVLVQLGLRYEHRPLAVGESAIVRLELTDEGWPKYQNVSLESSPAVVVETPALRDEREQTVYWRVRPVEPAAATLRWQFGDRTVEKRIDAASDPQRLAIVRARRPGRGFWDRLLNPAEPATPAGSPVRGIDVDYPSRASPMLGINAPWWPTFLLASILAALLVRPIVKVRY